MISYQVKVLCWLFALEMSRLTVDTSYDVVHNVYAWSVVLRIEIYKQTHKNTSTIKQTCKDAYKVCPAVVGADIMRTHLIPRIVNVI